MTAAGGYTNSRIVIADPEPSLATRIHDQGFSVITVPQNPVADIVLIAALQGHPKRAWLYGDDPGKPSNKIIRMFKKVASSEPTTPQSCYWPEDLLAHDFERCRIAVYGYDSRVSNFFKGAANQTGITGHGNSLLNALQALRMDAPSRPVIFIVHSLGGLILKEALRRSRGAEPYEEGLEAVYLATKLIIFMGTPHRGSKYAPWGLDLRNLAVATGFDANDKILRDLQVDAGIPDLLRTEFAKMLKDGTFDFWSLTEGRGLKGIKGLTGKVVNDVSSRLDDAREQTDTINANHSRCVDFRELKTRATQK